MQNCNLQKGNFGIIQIRILPQLLPDLIRTVGDQILKISTVVMLQ